MKNKNNIAVHARATVWRWPLNLMNISVQRLEDIENDQNSDEKKQLKKQHLAFGAGAIISSVGFLESIANTVIFDIEQQTPAIDRYEFDVKKVRSEILDEYESIYDNKHSSLVYEKTPKKYNELLNYASVQKFDESSDDLYQNVKSCIKFRDQLIHPKPENIPIQDEIDEPDIYGKHQSLQGALQGKGSSNPFTNAPLLRYLSHGYAKWAIKSVIRFTNEFYDRINTEPVYRDSIDKLMLSDLI